MLKQRIITAIVLVAVVLGCIFFLPLNLFTIVAALLVTAAGYEWGRFLCNKRAVCVVSAVVTLVIVAFSGGFVIEDIKLATFNDKALELMLSLSVLWWLFSVWMIAVYPRGTGFWFKSSWLKSFSGVLTLIPFYWAMVLVFAPGNVDAPMHGGWGLLSVMVLVWVADSGAYFCGRALGKNKLAPKVSPGKTREGLAGGVVLAVIVAAIIGYCIGYRGHEMYVWLVSSLAAVLFSVVGDLTESMFKREAGIKDSGQILPGHGGILDRIDSLTAALPVFVFFYRLLS
ncbi:phosphatidate cytidylyltransferase [Dongshaea marina]|uniref:phosphatidate cytidylyltransferase n=1 Tax=Dongshaea marina TaxID=2047966 RepID=UPI00131F3EBF|nr:phosphatidate cytidylyltransferase [Dongshaea marina]